AGDGATRAAEAAPEREREPEPEQKPEPEQEPTPNGAPQPEAAAAPDPTTAASGEGGRPTPLTAPTLARRIARERGVDLPGVRGTGPDGRILAEDVEKAPTGAPAAAPGAPPAPAE